MRFLHVGCGHSETPQIFEGIEEVRLDIDPGVKPDIVASMLAMGDIGDYERIYCSHALEHLHPHEVPVALSEFLRVLKPGGNAIVCVPDLEGVEPTGEVLYVSQAGPITGRDLFYGHAALVEISPYMAHHTGFTAATLGKALKDAGFADIGVKRVPPFYNLMAFARKPCNPSA